MKIKGKIDIEEKPFSMTKLYSGTYRVNSQWEDEIQTETYPFTVEVHVDNDNDAEQLGEITWTEEQPPHVDALEDIINANFFEMVG